MKIALLSDIHLGVKQDSEEFLENTKKFFLDFFIPTIKKQEVSQVFILGDLFDNQLSINVLVENTAFYIFNKILEECPNITIKVILGNHDIYYRNTLEISSINKFKNFNPRLKIIKTIEQIDLDGCKTLLVPWLVEGSKNLENFNKILKYYEKTNEKIFDLCLGHFEINSFEKVIGVVEKHGFDPDVFKAFSHVFSGHFHLRQKIKNIQYLGCPYEITWNDYGSKKGITIFDTISSETTFIENTTSPKHIKLKLSSILENEDELNKIENNFIKFHIDVDIDADKRVEVVDHIEKLKSLKLEIIDETISSLDDGDSVEINENIQGNALSVLNEYFDQTVHPNDINPDDFKLYMSKTYNDVLKEEE